MLQIGLTGGIGSGKSTVCRIFRDLGIKTFDSDQSAKDARNKPDVQEYLRDVYGESILTNGEYDNKKLSALVFNNKERLLALTNIISTHVIKDYYLFCKEYSTEPYTIFESAILFERGLGYLFDKVICVLADEEVRIKRVMDRNNFTRDEVIARMNNQVSENELIQLGDFFIINNNDINYLHYLEKEVARVDIQLRNQC
jgi:dephospho-CoA kinase